MEESPFFSGQEKDRKERDDDDHQREEDRASDLPGGRQDRRLAPGAAPGGIGPGQVPVRVLDHDDRCIDQDADRQSEPSERHDVGGDTQERHRKERDDDRDGQHGDRHQRRAEVVQEDQDDEGHDDHFLDQRALQSIDRPMDQFGPVVSDLELHPRRKGPGELRDFLLGRLDDGQDVFAGADHDDTADRFPFPVPVDDAAAHLGPEVNRRDVGEIDRRSRRDAGADWDPPQVVQVLDIAASAHHVFAAGPLDHAATDVAVRLLHRGQDVVESDPVGGKPARIDLHLILLLETADRGDLCHARHRAQPVGEVPVLERAQVRQRVPARPVHENVLEAPAHSGRVRTEVRVDPLGKLTPEPVQIFEHAAARPVEVRSVLKNDVDVREAEEGVAADGLDLRGGDERGDDRVRELVFDEVRVLALPVRVDDHLDVREIRKSVERDPAERPEAGSEKAGHADDRQELVANAERDELLDHRGGPGVGLPNDCAGCPAAPAGAAPIAPMRDSESIRKLADVTTVSPSERPVRTSTKSFP